MSNSTRTTSIKRTPERNRFQTVLHRARNAGNKDGFPRACLALVCLLAVSSFAQGQSSDPNVRYTQGEVNQSATLSLEVPLGNYKGRGLDLPVSLSYSSSVWRIEQLNKIHYDGVPQSVTQAIYAEHSVAGWTSTLNLPKVEFPKQTDTYDYRARQYPSNTWNGCFGYRIARLFIHMPDGSTHEFRESDQPYYSDTIDMWGTFYAVDGSRMRYDSTGVDTGTLYLPDGTRYVLGHPSSSIIDANGNTQTYNENTRQWTDMLNRVIANPLPLTPEARDYDYYLPGLSGNTLHYIFKWRNLSDSLTLNADGSTPALDYMASHYLPNPNLPPTSTGFGNSPVAQSTQYQSLFQTATPYDPIEDPDNGPVPVFVVGKGQPGGQLFNPVVLQEIVLSDGTSYKFSYSIYGEVSKVVYPTTAYDKYDYASSLLDVDQEQQPYVQAKRRVTSRQSSVNGLGTDILEWKYLETPGIGYRVISIIAPDKTRTEIYQYDPKAPNDQGKVYWTFDFASTLQGLVFQKQIYSTSADGLGGAMLRREITQFEQTTSGYTFAVTCGQSPFSKPITVYRNPRPIKTVEIIFEGSGPALAQTSTFVYDTSDEMRTGVDQIMETATNFAVVDNSIAQTGTMAQIPVGSLAKYSETTYLNSPGQPYLSIYRDNKNILGLPTVVKVKDSAGNIVSQNETRYDESGYSPEVGRALATSSRVWDSTKGAATDPNAYLMTRAKFDNYGNSIEATDANGNTTLTEYDASYQAFPVKVTTPIPDPNPWQNPDGQPHGSQAAFVTTTTFDYQAGLALSVTDMKGEVTQFEYNDPFLRLTRTVPPAGGSQVITEYGLGTTAATRYVKLKTQTDAINWKEATVFYDGIGRTIKTQLKDLNGDIFTETQYDNMGRIKQVTNPYRASDPVFWTANTYDDLGRISGVTMPDTALFQTSYGLSVTGIIGFTKTNTDQAGKKRSGISDALGRMIRVIEDPDTQNLTTDYVFDTLGNLRKTIQGEQSRYFMYDSLGRVLYSKQPEQETNASLNATDSVTGNTQWAMKFTYDDNGNNISQTDARGLSVSVICDHLNRVIFRDYSDATPDVNFYYDGTGLAQAPLYSKGETTRVSSSASESSYTAFDNLGRIKSSQQITNGVTYSFPDYTYDWAGNLISETYPSGRVVKTTLDPNGNLAKVESQKNSSSPWATYLDQITYNASGAAKESRLGNGRWETALYNSRLQITQIGLGSSNADTSLLKIQFDYGSAAQNNGALKEQQITASGMAQPIVQSYAYDDLNRLQSSIETYNGGTLSWKQTFSYDRFGNRRFDAANTTVPSGGLPSVTNPLINTSDNRFSAGQGYLYDKAGSVTQNAQGQRFVYDAEGRQAQFFSATNGSTNPDATYSYDGEAHRVRKTSGPFETIFVYDAMDRLVSEYSNEAPVNSGASYLTADHLGSPRIVTNQSGQVIARHDYRGFGEEVTSAYANRSAVSGYGAIDGIRKQFTGYERDTESGLDYAQLRYYDSMYGRFTSVDPLTASATIRNPQTFNRYSYVTNSPYKFTDPLGLFGICPGGGQGGQGGMPLGSFSATPLKGKSAAPPPPIDNNSDEPGQGLAPGPDFGGKLPESERRASWSNVDMKPRYQLTKKPKAQQRPQQQGPRRQRPQPQRPASDLSLPDVQPSEDHYRVEKIVRDAPPSTPGQQQENYDNCTSAAMAERLKADIIGGVVLYGSLRTATRGAAEPIPKIGSQVAPAGGTLVGITMLQKAKSDYDTAVGECKKQSPNAVDKPFRFPDHSHRF
ncbi:MAG TPA: RHS repeat-associated core domain-containing protein [Pyrinomonadaceae bacterium]|nr:RHS repeat-associated core domain-containing protein [Pyrinomonadaceae bacterium]